MLVDPLDTYVILSKSGTTENRKQIATFLERTTFGPKMSEIDALDDGTWSTNGDQLRAQHVRQQMDANITSHREYWRKRTNAKWDATALPARSSHPCSPNSKWRKYSFLRQDQRQTVTDEYLQITFEDVPEEAGSTYTIYEADVPSDVTSFGGSATQFKNSSTTFYRHFSGEPPYASFVGRTHSAFY